MKRGLLIFLLLPSFAYAVVVNPVETDELLKNPGKGWMTMFEAAIHDSTLPNDIPSSLFYYRPSWDKFHTGPDQYDWSGIDRAIEDAQAGGQQIMLRMMPVAAGSSSPGWMRDAGYNGWSCDGGWHADLSDPNVREHVSKFLQALAERYDDHPGFHSIEINFHGCWGEGNAACGCPAAILGDEETQRWLADEHYRYFQTLPIIGPSDTANNVMITKYMVEEYGDMRGAGIFMDCWGDYDLYGSWSHMNDGYPKWLNFIHNGAEWDSWKQGIWKLEPCGTMDLWGADDVRNALQWALDNHGTFIGNKDANIPSENIDDVKETLKTIGYRLVLREAEFPGTVTGSLELRLDIENIGVAPPYRDYYLAVELHGAQNQKFVSDESVKFMQPGTSTFNIEVPLTVPEGSYDLAVAIVYPFDEEPAILMPIEGRESSGWHPVGSLIVGHYTPACDNEVCDVGECDSCPADCTLVDCCPDGTCNNDETCETCESDCDACLIDCVHEADLPVCDGCVDTVELSAYVNSWKSGNAEINELMEVIGLWKSGC